MSLPILWLFRVARKLLAAQELCLYSWLPQTDSVSIVLGAPDPLSFLIF